MTILTDIPMRNDIIAARTSRIFSGPALAVVNWCTQGRSAHELKTQLDKMDDHRLEDIGLVRRTRQVGWTTSVRGGEPTPVFHSTYEQGAGQ